MTTTSTLANDFSRIAAQYERYAVPQRWAALDLLGKIGKIGDSNLFFPEKIGCCPLFLELGCGTGLYTRMLLDAFPGAQIVGIDISEAMLRVAREQGFGLRVVFHAADAETLCEGSYNLITSNAAFQWFTDLPGTLQRLAGMLAPSGTLAFSYFGPETYRELDQVLRETLGENVRASSTRFAGRQQLAQALDAAGLRWEMQAKGYTQVFPR